MNDPMEKLTSLKMLKALKSIVEFTGRFFQGYQATGYVKTKLM